MLTTAPTGQPAKPRSKAWQYFLPGRICLIFHPLLFGNNPANNCTNWTTSQTENLGWKNWMVVPASTFGECWQLHQLDNQPNQDQELDSIFYLEESDGCSCLYFLGMPTTAPSGQPAKPRSGTWQYFLPRRICLIFNPFLFGNVNNCTNWATSQTENLACNNRMVLLLGNVDNCLNWTTSQTEDLAWNNRMVVPASTFGECQQLHQLDNQPNWTTS